jgi:hypothetical protein
LAGGFLVITAHPFQDYLSSFKKKLIKNKLLRISKGQVDIDYKIFPSKNMK